MIYFILAIIVFVIIASAIVFRKQNTKENTNNSPQIETLKNSIYKVVFLKSDGKTRRIRVEKHSLDSADTHFNYSYFDELNGCYIDNDLVQYLIYMYMIDNNKTNEMDFDYYYDTYAQDAINDNIVTDVNIQTFSTEVTSQNDTVGATNFFSVEVVPQNETVVGSSSLYEPPVMQVIRDVENTTPIDSCQNFNVRTIEEDCTIQTDDNNKNCCCDDNDNSSTCDNDTSGCCDSGCGGSDD